jgi:SSS family solute:Na+ symporter
VFALGLLTHRVAGAQAIAGMLAGIVFNGCCWRYLPEVSWLWWNVFGFAVTFATAFLLSLVVRPTPAGAGEEAPSAYLYEDAIRTVFREEARVNWYRRCAWLFGWFVLLVALLALLGA